MRQLDAEYRLDKNIKIAMLYLEDDDAVSAEAFIKKASALIGSCKASAPRPPSTETPNCADPGLLAAKSRCCCTLRRTLAARSIR